MKIVGRRVYPGIRYGGIGQEKHEIRQRRIESELQNALDSSKAREVAPTKAQPKPPVRERILWQSIPVDEFDLDCERAIETLVAKLGTYTERNRQRTLEFIAELRKLVVERGGDEVTFRVTGVGTFAHRTVLRLEHRMGNGEVREHVIPGGFREMCRDAITRKPHKSNDTLFPKKRKPNWKQRIPYDD